MTTDTANGLEALADAVRKVKSDLKVIGAGRSAELPQDVRAQAYGVISATIRGAGFGPSDERLAEELEELAHLHIGHSIGMILTELPNMPGKVHPTGRSYAMSVCDLLQSHYGFPEETPVRNNPDLDRV